MNQKHIGIIVILIGLLLAGLVFVMKAREDSAIGMLIEERDSCFLEDGTCLHEDRSLFVFIFGGIISAVLIVLGGYLVFFANEERTRVLKKIKQKDYSEIKKKLTDDENIVLEKVIGSEGTIFQSELVDKSGFTKVKVTRILDKLEGKGIIERRRRGMTNVIILKQSETSFKQ